MKKYAKLTFIVFFIVIILWVLGLQVPFIASKARERIDKGMTVTNVEEVLTSYSKKPDSCRWEKEGGKQILSDHKRCNFPIKDIPLLNDGKNIKLTVLFMGPAFLHNKFQVNFNSSGRVLSITEMKHWD